MIDATKAAKFVRQRDEVLSVICALDNLSDDPRTWTEAERAVAKALILRLGAPESFLRRFARADLI